MIIFSIINIYLLSLNLPSELKDLKDPILSNLTDEPGLIYIKII